MFTTDFVIIEKKNFGHFILIKNNLEVILKLYRSIIAIQKHGNKIYILVVENIQYSGHVSWNVLVWSCSLNKRSPSAGPDKLPTSQIVARADVDYKAACHVFVIFQTKRNECEKNILIKKNKILDLFFETS